MNAMDFVALGDEGMDYVEDHLANTNIFCNALHDLIAQCPGQAFAFVPVGTSRERALNFRAGGLLANPNASRTMLPDGSMLERKPDVKLAHARFFLAELQTATPSHVCIIDDFNPKWSEGGDFGPASFGVVDEVYHIHTTRSTEEDIEQNLADSDTIWHAVAALCANAPKIAEDTSTEAELVSSALSATLLTCTAYDGESFVLWRRDEMTA